MAPVLLPNAPARKIPIGTRSVTGSMPNGEKFESTLERDLMYLLRFDPTVDHFTAQPITIEYQDEAGRARKYTPDILIQYQRGKKPVLGEVKYRSDLRKDFKEFRPKFKAAIRYARERSWRFKIFTDREIRTPYLANAKFLLPYQSTNYDANKIEQVRNTLKELSRKDVESLLTAMCQDFQGRGELLPVIWYLIASRRIGCDLAVPLTMQSSIWLQEG